MKRRSFLKALLAGSASAVAASLAGPVQLGAGRLKVIDPKWVSKKALPWENPVPRWDLILYREEDHGAGGRDQVIQPLSLLAETGIEKGDWVLHDAHRWQVLSANKVTSLWKSVPSSFGASVLYAALGAP